MMNQKNNKILTINVSTELSKKILRNFASQRYIVTIADNLQSKFVIDSINDYHLIVVGASDSQNSPQQLEEVSRSNPLSELIVVNNSTIYTDNDYLNSRVSETISENISDESLVTKINRAFRSQHNKAELTVLKQQVAMNYGFDNLIGNSKPMLMIKESIRKVAPTDISVMLTGPSGSGKTLTAQIIHYHSDRRRNKFVSIDCSAIPGNIIEEVLFGKQSDSTDFGQIAQADNGTFFIKDIDKLPLSTQYLFADFFRTHTIRKSGIESKKINIRIISSTESNILTQISNGSFSEELAHLFGEITVKLPTLSERIDDIELITEYFTRQISFETGQLSYAITRGALELLFAHHWTGNIRELENTIKRATTLCKNHTIEDTDILFVESGQPDHRTSRFEAGNNAEPTTGRLDEGQRNLIVKALNDNRWNFTQTAQELGIGRTTLWRKVKKYNLKKEETELI